MYARKSKDFCRRKLVLRKACMSGGVACSGCFLYTFTEGRLEMFHIFQTLECHQSVADRLPRRSNRSRRVGCWPAGRRDR